MHPFLQFLSSTWPCKALSSACDAAVLLSSASDEGPYRWRAQGISAQRQEVKGDELVTIFYFYYICTSDDTIEGAKTIKKKI